MTDQSMWQSAPFDATIDHILQRYHDTHRRQFDDILPLAEKVGSVHADTFPQQLLPLLQSVAAELGQHMMKEERPARQSIVFRSEILSLFWTKARTI